MYLHDPHAAGLVQLHHADAVVQLMEDVHPLLVNHRMPGARSWMKLQRVTMAECRLVGGILQAMQGIGSKVANKD